MRNWGFLLLKFLGLIIQFSYLLPFFVISVSCFVSSIATSNCYVLSSVYFSSYLFKIISHRATYGTTKIVALLAISPQPFPSLKRVKLLELCCACDLKQLLSQISKTASSAVIAKICDVCVWNRSCYNFPVLLFKQLLRDTLHQLLLHQSLLQLLLK